MFSFFLFAQIWSYGPKSPIVNDEIVMPSLKFLNFCKYFSLKNEPMCSYFSFTLLHYSSVMSPKSIHRVVKNSGFIDNNVNVNSNTSFDNVSLVSYFGL